MTNCSGVGRIGSDFWPVRKVGNGLKTLNERYPESVWAQLGMDFSTQNLLAPGPDGAIPTERFEQIRQGIQDCEARIFIEKAILSGKLSPEMVKKCWDTLDQRQERIHAWDKANYWEGAATADGLAEKLYSCAAEVTKRLKQ